MSNVKLSIRLMTYNHADFIEDALKGIDQQQTNFDFEVVIGDDFSSDNTLQLIKDYPFTNPNITVNILERKKGDAYDQERQIRGRLYNFINILDNCKGEYIALLDGDDYWIDPLKLQKQVDFLEANLDYIMCFTNINEVDEQGQLIRSKKLNYKKDIFEHMDMPVLAPTLTRVMRNKYLNNIDFNGVQGGDNYLLTYHSQFGKTKFLDEITAHYRIHGEGVYSSLSSESKLKHLVKTRLECTKIADNNLYLKLFAVIYQYSFKLVKNNYYEVFDELLPEIYNKINTEGRNISWQQKVSLLKIYFLFKAYRKYKFHRLFRLLQKQVSKYHLHYGKYILE